ncbi:M23 family metallopeptidase [candidate division WOR-3 bacterium]|nr:M23 family metallopeptidase [candidate division WOR-3 bacterium]
MKRNEDRFLTILFIPHNAKSPHVIKIPYFYINSAIILLVLIVIFSTVSFFTMRYYANQKSMLDRKNRSLICERDTLYEIIDQVESIKNELIVLEQLRINLRSKIYEDSQSANYQNDMILADLLPPLGGSSSEYQGYNSLKRTYDEILFLKNQMPTSFDLAEKTLSEAESIDYELAHIPSINPTEGHITSGFGFREDPFLHTTKFHHGVDIPNSTGTHIWAAADGVVNFAGTMSGYGNIIRIHHNCSLETVYAHLDSFAVRLGEKVQKGQLIGYMGSTGRSTDPHLHYEVRINDEPVNPVNFIKN